MKVLSYSKNSKTPASESKIHFEAGLTYKMLEEIEQSDVLVISKKISKAGISNEFKDNKMVAWSCNQVINIIQQLNKRFKAKIPLPKGIYVEDFRNLDDNPDAFGTCTLLPSKLIKNSETVIPEKTIFFNSAVDWNNVDKIADLNYAARMFSSDFFLYPFMHEFSHVIHLDSLINMFKGKNLVDKLEFAVKNESINKLSNNERGKIASIADYALKNPLDTIACDIPTRIIEALDKENLKPLQNPFLGTPYEKLPLRQRENLTEDLNKERSLNEILKDFWNGKFD